MVIENARIAVATDTIGRKYSTSLHDTESTRLKRNLNWYVTSSTGKYVMIMETVEMIKPAFHSIYAAAAGSTDRAMSHDDQGIR